MEKTVIEKDVIIRACGIESPRQACYNKGEFMQIRFFKYPSHCLPVAAAVD